MNLRRLSAVSFGHMAIDILNASLAMILAVLAGPLSLSNADIALGAMAYTLMGSLTQPFFGMLADRLGGRWLGAVGLLWTAVFYFAATFSQSYIMLISLMTVGLAGQRRVPSPGRDERRRGGQAPASTATSIFFLLGQMGLAFGPMIVGVLLEEVWMIGPRMMSVATLPFVVWMAFSLRKPLVRVEPRSCAYTSRAAAARGRKAGGESGAAAKQGTGRRWWRSRCWWRCGRRCSRHFTAYAQVFRRPGVFAQRVRLYGRGHQRRARAGHDDGRHSRRSL